MNVRETIDAIISFPTVISILLKGRHGIGKSQIVKQAGEILKVPVIDFRLSQNDVGDLKGMPFHVNGRTVFAPPEFFPLRQDDADDLKKLLNLSTDISLGRHGDKGILFLDEINRANREVQQAAFELVLDRRMNLRKLPDGWRVVSAINDDDDIYTVNSLDPAFLSRFFLIDFKPTYEDWMKWAQDNKVHQSIVEFIRRYPDFLDPSPEILKECASKGVKKAHDRREWALFSETLNDLTAKYEAGTYAVDLFAKEAGALNLLTQIAEGFVGHLAGIKYRSFVETDYQALDADTILNKWSGEVEKKVKAIAKNRPGELGGLNEGIVTYIGKAKKLSTKQGDNLYNYLTAVISNGSNEPVADLWSKMNAEAKTVADEWYSGQGDAKAKVARNQLVLKAMVNPTASSKPPVKK